MQRQDKTLLSVRGKMMISNITQGQFDLIC